MAEATLDTNVNVLVVEDETEIRELMALHLLRHGFKVQESSSVEDALRKIQAQQFAVVILDWMLPGASGFDFLKNTKQILKGTSVLMVTAKTEPHDIVAGLEAGADDYLTKPFDPGVFLARVRSLLRRSQQLTTPTQSGKPVQEKHSIVIGDLSVNLRTYEVRLGSEHLHLTPSEFKLLTTLFDSQGKVLTRDQLIENIQGEGINVTGRTIDTHVFGLRKKLGAWSEHIETIRGVGYRVKMDPA